MQTDWKIIIDPVVKAKIDRLQPKTQKRIYDAIKTLATYPQTKHIRKLHGRDDYRLRVGKWRIIFYVDVKTGIIGVIEFGPRGDVYKK